jgi:phosphohistidine phosphatase
VKVLYLMRHAKSSWKDPSLEDFDRPLNKRGRKAGKAMAAHFQRDKIRPALVLCSAARRAQETLGYLRDAIGADTPFEIEDGLYHAGREGLLARLRKVKDPVPSVMLVGHNPGMEWLAMDLAGGGDKDAWNRLRAKYPTAALAVVTFDVKRWSDVKPGSGRLTGFVCPADLD